MMRSAHARWKKAADTALSFAHYEQERKDLARCLAGRLLNPRGLRSSHSLAVVACQDRARYEKAIAGLLDDFNVRLSLAARHLQLLYQNVKWADYEDTEVLTHEANWTRAYFEALLQCPIPMSPEWDQARSPGERRSRSFEEFLATVEGTVIPHLHSALESAA